MKPIVVHLKFFGSLSDFLPLSQKNKWIEVGLHDHAAVKDTIESCGVPHTEVESLFINGRSCRFSRRLFDGDRVTAYPYRRKVGGRWTRALRRAAPKRPRFILDIHLGKLARHLRLLGLDARYETDLTDEGIVRIAEVEKRVVLTRDIGLLKHKSIVHALWVRSKDPVEQLKEVLAKFDLNKILKPFSRCLECNGKIAMVAKRRIEDRLPPKVREFHRRFYLCQDCEKIYWQGSHYEWLSKFVGDLRLKNYSGSMT